MSRVIYRWTTRCALAAASTLMMVRLQAQTSAAAKPEEASDEVVRLSPFSISTERDNGYSASNSIAGTRTNTPIKDIAMNIQVFTKDLANDLMLTDQTQLERYNAALTNNGSDLHSEVNIQQGYNAFIFRGFIQNWGMRDGVREYDPIDGQGMARVEVVKGPAAAMYGLSYPGGIMNNISKEADLTRNFAQLRLTGYSEGGYRATVDANYQGKAADGKIAVRYNGAHAESTDKREHSDGSVRFNQMTFAWDPLAGTDIRFTAEQGFREKPNGLGYFTRTGANGAVIPLQIDHPEIPWTWNWATGDNQRSSETALYRGLINQSIGDDFSINAYVQYSDRANIDSDGYDASGSGGAATWDIPSKLGTGWNPTGTHPDTIRMAYHYRDWVNTMHAYGTTAVYKLETGPVKNTFTAGFNSWKERFISKKAAMNNAVDPDTGALIDFTGLLDLPIRKGINTLPATTIPPSTLEWTQGNYERNKNEYYFASWQTSSFNNRLKTNIAINRTKLTLVQYTPGTNTITSTTKASKNSPMYGIMFDVTKEVSAFYVYSTSLFPTTTKNDFDVQMPPIVGKSHEIGTKFEFLEGKISGTVSYYQITQTGGTQRDASAINRNKKLWDSMTAQQRIDQWGTSMTRDQLTDREGQLGDYVAGAEQESKGFEADLMYQPLPEWQIVFSFANNKQETTEAINKTLIGQTISGHIKTQYSLLTKYTFNDGALKGAFAGLGLNAAAKRLEDYSGPNNTARYTPSSLYAEVFGGYRFKLGGLNHVVQFNAKDITEVGEYVGWKEGNVTKRYKVPTHMRLSLTWGLDF